MQSPQIVSSTGRRRRLRRRLVIATIGLTLLVKIGWRGNADANPATVQSGPYQLIQVNADASLKFAIPNTPRQQIDVRWLAIEITHRQQVVDWIESQFRPGALVQIRLDRRRLDEDGKLSAYFFRDAQLLNAELVRRGWAREAAHPSDFAPIARQIRQAKSHASENAG